ncbi:replicative DNA helicase [Chlamydia abortus]|nr:replicative DNA helicase [Chlamydia abortus]
MLILAARPSVGKTAFALNIAKNIVQKSFSSKDNKSISGKTVLFFSLEMSASQLTQRILSMQTKIPASKFKTGDLEAAD